MSKRKIIDVLNLPDLFLNELFKKLNLSYGFKLLFLNQEWKSQYIDWLKGINFNTIFSINTYVKINYNIFSQKEMKKISKFNNQLSCNYDYDINFIFINDNNYFYKIQFSIFDNSIYLLSYNSLFFWLPSRYLFISDKIEISDNIPKIPDLIVPFYDKESGIIFGNLNYYTNELVYINFNDHSHHNFISTFRYFHHLKNTNSSIGNYIILSSLSIDIKIQLFENLNPGDYLILYPSNFTKRIKYIHYKYHKYPDWLLKSNLDDNHIWVKWEYEDKWSLLQLYDILQIRFGPVLPHYVSGNQIYNINDYLLLFSKDYPIVKLLEIRKFNSLIIFIVQQADNNLIYSFEFIHCLTFLKFESLINAQTERTKKLSYFSCNFNNLRPGDLILCNYNPPFKQSYKTIQKITKSSYYTSPRKYYYKNSIIDIQLTQDISTISFINNLGIIKKLEVGQQIEFNKKYQTISRILPGAIVLKESNQLVTLTSFEPFI